MLRYSACVDLTQLPLKQKPEARAVAAEPGRKRDYYTTWVVFRMVTMLVAHFTGFTYDPNLGSGYVVRRICT